MPVATTVTNSSNVAQRVSRSDPQGVQLSNASDLMSFFGVTPVAQTSGPAQGALARGVAYGTVATYASSNSPGQVISLSSAEKALTMYVGANGTGTGPTHNIIANDLLFVNKPTNQAGLGLGNARVSGAGVIEVTFTNYSTSAITATAGEKYAVVALRGFTQYTNSISPAAVASNSVSEQQFTFTGVRAGEVVVAIKPTAQTGLDIVNARVVANNTVGITFANPTAAAITPTAAETYTVFSLGGLDMVGNNMLVGAYGGAPASVAATSLAEQAITMTGLATTDAVVGISKPSVTSSLGIAGARVSGANSLGVSYINMAAAASPATNEVYEVQIFRPNPVAPVVNYTATLTPTAVGPQTTVAQDFTVTGIVANSVVWVNKPSVTAGIGIAGVRVSAANIIEISFANLTTATITPPSEAYLIANFQQAIGDAGSCWISQASPQQQNAVILLNAIRNALAGNGLIAGA